MGVGHQSLQIGLERYTSQFFLLMVGGGCQPSKSTNRIRAVYITILPLDGWGWERVGVSHQNLLIGLERYTSQFLLLMVGGGCQPSKSTNRIRAVYITILPLDGWGWERVGVSHQNLLIGLERYTSQFLLLMVGGGGRSSKSTNRIRAVYITILPLDGWGWVSAIKVYK